METTLIYLDAQGKEARLPKAIFSALAGKGEVNVIAESVCHSDIPTHF